MRLEDVEMGVGTFCVRYIRFFGVLNLIYLGRRG